MTAGFRFLDVPADADGPALDGAMWYPCSEPPGEIDLGKITATLPGVENCPISGDKLPLVVVSHGRSSHFVLHHDTAETLADPGFIVAAKALTKRGDPVGLVTTTSDCRSRPPSYSYRFSS